MLSDQVRESVITRITRRERAYQRCLISLAAAFRLRQFRLPFSILLYYIALQLVFISVDFRRIDGVCYASSPRKNPRFVLRILANPCLTVKKITDSRRIRDKKWY
ncbi:hypothetical protein L2E82_40623 [Cichorium intybus]|uniref:Uncharacterized protein n=1 Tax=Cichorium intybus TaxID=13427 RepID=A0ACB9AMG1_CICIN|nr:hypothetical protein L2E82_40623 [Cichorium intybus]